MPGAEDQGEQELQAGKDGNGWSPGGFETDSLEEYRHPGAKEGGAETEEGGEQQDPVKATADELGGGGGDDQQGDHQDRSDSLKSDHDGQRQEAGQEQVYQAYGQPQRSGELAVKGGDEDLLVEADKKEDHQDGTREGRYDLVELANDLQRAVENAVLVKMSVPGRQPYEDDPDREEGVEDRAEVWGRLDARGQVVLDGAKEEKVRAKHT